MGGANELQAYCHQGICATGSITGYRGDAAFGSRNREGGVKNNVSNNEIFLAAGFKYLGIFQHDFHPCKIHLRYVKGLGFNSGCQRQGRIPVQADA
jgi:hypothetical protein